MRGPTERVMLVDDDPDIRLVAEIALSRVGGWEVIVTSSGQAALDTLNAAADAALPDVVLLDVTMPGLSGPEVIAAMRKSPRLRTVPVIFMTANVQREDVAGYLALGAIGVVHKPFQAMSLPDLVREILAGA